MSHTSQPFNFTKSISQDIEFSNLKYLLQNEIEKSDTYISNKGFRYHKTDKEENDDSSSIIWSYERDVSNNRAEAFIARYCFELKKGFVWCQFGNREVLDKIKSYCKSSGFSLTVTETDPFGSLCYSFESDNYKIEFCSGINEESKKLNLL